MTNDPWISQAFFLPRERFSPCREGDTLSAAPFDPDRLADYAGLLYEAFLFQEPKPELEELTRYLEEMQREPYFIASFRCFWQEGELIGFYWLKENQVDKLAVSPRCQRRGYGSRLLSRAFEDVFASGQYDSAVLYCMLQNTGGLAFYRRYGLLEGPVE